MNKKILSKRMAAFFLAVVMFCVSVTAGDVPVQAAGSYVSIIHKVSTATALTPLRYNFAISKPDIHFTIRTNERTGVKFTIRDPEHDTALADHYLPATNPDWAYKKDTGIYENTYLMKLDAGSYVLELTFDSGVSFELSVDQITDEANLASPKLTVTKGFSSTIKVNNGKIKSCSSSNKKVASVTNTGKVTGKKTGTAKITVTFTNGKKLVCTVTVKANQYSAKKLTISQVAYHRYGMKAYSASFDSKGNLVVKFMVANNNSGKITAIPKFRITVKDQKKKTAATFKKDSYSVTVNSYSEKSCTVTIPKSSLKGTGRTVDLRNSTITVSGQDAETAF